MKLEKTPIIKKKKNQVNQVNQLNPWHGSWDWSNHIESKLQQNHEIQYPIN
jgi:hypothetical protein